MKSTRTSTSVSGRSAHRYANYETAGDRNGDAGGGIEWLRPRRPGFESLVGLGPLRSLEALHVCTESLGFESSDETDSTASSPRCLAHLADLDSVAAAAAADDADPAATPIPRPPAPAAPRNTASFAGQGHLRFPPPLPSIVGHGQGQGGGQGQGQGQAAGTVMMKSYKRDGRFVLQEVRFRAPPQETLLHTWRRDGRLKMHLVTNAHAHAHAQGSESGNGNGGPRLESVAGDAGIFEGGPTGGADGQDGAK